MKTVVLMAGLFAIGTPAFADPTVVEYEDRIVVEYAGLPPEVGTVTYNQDVLAKNSEAVVKARGLISLIRALATEGNEVVKADGTETSETLQAKKQNADRLLARINTYLADLQKLWEKDKSLANELGEEMRQLRACVETLINTATITYAEAATAKAQLSKSKAADVKVCCISAVETERTSNYVTYSIKADIDNKGTKGEIFVKLVAKNRDGHQIDFVSLRAPLEPDESRTLTTTTMLTYQQAMDARTWEVDSVSKY